MRTSFFLMVALAGCGEVDSPHSLPDAPVAPDAAISVDAPGADTPTAPLTCDGTKGWSAPAPVPGLQDATLEVGNVRMAPDELTAYFQVLENGQYNLYSARRASRAEAFGPRAPINAANSNQHDVDPTVTPDGLAVFFGSNRVDAQGWHIYVASRATTLAEFGAPGLAAGINAASAQDSDIQPFLSADGQELWFGSSRVPSMGGFDIWRSTRTASGFSAPVPMTALSSTDTEWFPMVSADRLTVYLASSRPGGKGDFDVWSARRSTVNDGFPAPSPVAALNTAGHDHATWISVDDCRIYGFGDGHIWMATRLP